jgi:hypothetical protein
MIQIIKEEKIKSDGSVSNLNANKLLCVNGDGSIKAIGFSSRVPLRSGFIPIITSDMSQIVSGTSAATTVRSFGVEFNAGTTSTTGYAIRNVVPSNQNALSIGVSAGVIRWSVDTVEIVNRWNVNSNFDAGCTARFHYGRTNTYPTGASIAASVNSIELRYTLASGLQLICVNNSGTITTATSTFTPTANITFEWRIIVSGGVALLYVNGSLVATNNGGPNADGAASANLLSFGLENTGTVSANSALKTSTIMMEIY